MVEALEARDGAAARRDPARAPDAEGRRGARRAARRRERLALSAFPDRERAARRSRCVFHGNAPTADLAARLREAVAGEVLFDRRVARPLCDRRVDLPGRAGRRRRSAQRTTTCARSSTSAASSASRCCRAAPAARNAGRRSARRWSSITASTSNRIGEFDREAHDRDGRARRRARSAQRVAAAARRVVSRSTSARRRRRRWAAWPATIPAARARSATATWCTTSRRSTRCSPTAPRRASARCASMARRAAARARAARGLEAIGERERDEIARQVPKVLRRVGGYNIDVFHPQSERPYTADGSVNFAHLLVGSEGTLAWTRALTLELAPLPTHRALGVVNFPTLYRAMQCARSDRHAGADGGRAGRPHDDRPRARQSRVPPGRSTRR